MLSNSDLFLQQLYTISLTFRISSSVRGEHACTKYKRSIISRLLLFKYIRSEIHYVLLSSTCSDKKTIVQKLK